MGKYQPSILGVRLKEARKRVGLRQDELAQRSGVGKISISRLESGIVQWCSSETLQRLEGALGLSLGEPLAPSLQNVIAKDNFLTPLQRSHPLQGRSVPLIGKIPEQCPHILPLIASGIVDVPEALLPEGEACACVVDGWSMREGGYCPGDIAIIARCYWSQVQTQDVCAVTRLGETTLARIEIRGEEQAQTFWLVPQNQDVDGEQMPLYPERQINPSEYQMEGKVFSVMRRLGS